MGSKREGEGGEAGGGSRKKRKEGLGLTKTLFVAVIGETNIGRLLLSSCCSHDHCVSGGRRGVLEEHSDLANTGSICESRP